MRLFSITLFGALVCSTAAVACPALNMSQGATTYETSQLASPVAVGLAAGGENRLEQCGLGALGFGQFRSVPDHSFMLAGASGPDVTLAVTSGCDAAMLVNTADGQWHFNDDGNGNLDPRLTIPAGAPLDGQVDVWIGTFAGGGCEATLNITHDAAALPMSQPGGGGGAAPVAPEPLPAQPPAPQGETAQAPQPAPVPAPVPAPLPTATCPNPEMVGPSLNVTGQELMSPQAYVAQVGAGHEVEGCPGIEGWGYADEAPSFTLYMSRMNGMRFTAEMVSDCDPTMILRDATGQWHFNDDGPNALQPQLQVGGAALNGRVDIWVGSFGGSTCEGTIVFRTAATAAPATPPAGGGAAGCPDPSLQGAVVNTTGSSLYSPTDYTLTAGGGQDLSACGLPVSARGFVSAAPAYSFFLSGMADYGRLEIEGESNCDTVMLVRTPDGQWHFDDDSNGNLDPLINVTNTGMLDGRVDVWVGTYGGGTCPATIEMETWRN
jgi:hypothetical protein